MKVLIVRVGAMGDVLHAMPAVAALRSARPGWMIDWVVDQRWASLLTGDTSPLVNRVHLADTKAWSAAPISVGTARSVHELRRALRQEHYDLVVDMQGTMRSSVIGRLAAAEALVGYSDPREALAARLYTRRLTRTGTHVVDQGAALLAEATGVELAAQPAAVALTESAEAWAEGEAVVARPLCVLAPGGGWGAKQWPAAKYGALARKLGQMGYDVVVNGPRVGDQVSEAVVAASQGAARLVVCDVAGLIALLRRTDLFFGGDTGPTHLAAALAVPLVALFGPTDPARNGPWGPGPVEVLRSPDSVTTYKRSDDADPGLAAIEVEQVLRRVHEGEVFGGRLCNCTAAQV